MATRLSHEERLVRRALSAYWRGAVNRAPLAQHSGSVAITGADGVALRYVVLRDHVTGKVRAVYRVQKIGETDRLKRLKRLAPEVREALEMEESDRLE